MRRNARRDAVAVRLDRTLAGAALLERSLALEADRLKGSELDLALPETIPTKISSEAAGYVSMTPVARRELPAAELIEHILSVIGKNPKRILEILSRGTFVGGASRFRWEIITATEAELATHLARFPDAEPERPFRAEGCNLIVMHGHRGNVSLSRDVASEKRLFKRRSFWDLLVPALGALSPSYQRYSYSERADVYQVRLTLESVKEMLEHAKLLKYSSIIEQLSYLDATSAELFVER